MIKLDNLFFSYGKRELLHGISACMENGFTVILGENGSGKSTLLRIMAGHIRVDGCTLNGRPVDQIPPMKRARSLAYLSQSGYISSDISVMDAVLLGRYCYVGLLSAYSQKDKKAALDAMDKCHILHLADRSVLTLSGGELKMVLLACCLAQLEEDSHLLLDEPTNDLDVHRQLELMHTVKQISASNTVVAVLHDIATAANYADNIIVLKDVWHVDARLEKGTSGYYLDIVK